MPRKPVRCWLSRSWSPPSVEKLCLPSSTTALEVPLAAIGFFHEAAGLTRPAGIWVMAPVKAARRRGSGTDQQRPLALVELGVMCTRLVVPACQLGDPVVRTAAALDLQCPPRRRASRPGGRPGRAAAARRQHG
jgi:hypothetical protein